MREICTSGSMSGERKRSVTERLRHRASLQLYCPRTVNKMLADRSPPPRKIRMFTLPVLGPHIETVRRLIADHEEKPQTTRLSAKTIYELLRTNRKYTGSYSAVKEFVSKCRSQHKLSQA